MKDNNKNGRAWALALALLISGAHASELETKTLEIAVVTDWETVEYFRSASGARLYFDTTVEEAAQLFREQLGIDLVVVEETIPTTPKEDTIGAYNHADPLLEDVLMHRITQGQHRRSDVTVMFTRRRLVDDRTSLGGYATNTVCSVASGAIVRVENDGVDYQVLAHELAHTIGAVHDAEGPCEGESATGWLMGAQFQPASAFSQCSVRHMQALLATQGECLTNVGRSAASDASESVRRRLDSLWIGLICSGSLIVLLAPVTLVMELLLA